MLKGRENETPTLDITSGLMHLIDTWKQMITDDDIDAVTKATLHAVLYVAENIMHQRAVLLPSVSQVFLAAYTSDDTGDKDMLEGTIKYSTRWLLNQIILYLQPYIDYKCIHKKFGTLIFCKNGDILTSLSWALGRVQLSNSEESYTKTITNNTRITILREAGDIINDLIHEEISKQDSDNIYEGGDIKEMKIDEEIKSINPYLWSFIESATRTVHERKSGYNDERNVHIKKLRRFYSLRLLMYCTNSQKPTKLHFLLADIVEMCGGSRNLTKILNQLGIVA